MVRVTRVSKEQLINEFGTNKSYSFRDNQIKSSRTSEKQSINGFELNASYYVRDDLMKSSRIGKNQLDHDDRMNKSYQYASNQMKFIPIHGRQLIDEYEMNIPWQIKNHRSKSEDLQYKSMNDKSFIYTTMVRHPNIDRIPSFNHNSSIGQSDLTGSSYMMKNSKVIDLSSVRSITSLEKKKQRHKFRCRITPKGICCCLTTLFLLGAIIALITVLVIELNKSNSTVTTTVSTVTTTTVTTSSSTTTTTSMILTLASTVNWIINGDGETGPCEPNDNITHPTGWNYNGTITQIYYNNSDGSAWYTDPGPSNRGNCYFYGQKSAVTAMWQTINMSSAISTSLIDNQLVWFNFSAWLGGYTAQDDNAQASLIFLDQTNQKVGNTITLGPILAVDRQNITSLIFCQSNGRVPVSARSFTIVITITRAQGQTSDGTVDNIAVLLYQ